MKTLNTTNLVTLAAAILIAVTGSACATGGATSNASSGVEWSDVARTQSSEFAEQMHASSTVDTTAPAAKIAAPDVSATTVETTCAPRNCGPKW